MLRTHGQTDTNKAKVTTDKCVSAMRTKTKMAACACRYWKCSIKGAESGKLAGRRVVIKDNVCVAGVPMMDGSRVLEGYVPEQDATIVRWLLDAGAHVVGKSSCEDLCLSGVSFHSAYGPVHNPWNKLHSAGGSSHGSAVLVSSSAVRTISGLRAQAHEGWAVVMVPSLLVPTNY